MADKRNRMGRRSLVLIGIMAVPLLMAGCGHFSETIQSRQNFEEAHLLFKQGRYQESLDSYEQIIDSYPTTGDRALFEMGLNYSYPDNEQKDYGKSQDCFRKLIADYPDSDYRSHSEAMIFYLNNVPIKDRMVATQQTTIETLQSEVKEKEAEIAALQRKIGELEKNVFAYAIQKPTIDKILIEKQARRMLLLSKGKVLKSYRIALGGNPIGPKERQGDNKTPEGTYTIDSRNRDSRYHCALRISYPNERDRKRARELGVSPGGDIMIHGIKNGFAQVGDAHAESDWTKGCIAVTDEEIEELDKLVPNGTVVEIKP